MKKGKTTSKPYPENEQEAPKVEEPYFTYPNIIKKQAALADFSYKKFQQIADKVPFTISDWAKVLHLSERTLQRYAKDNKNFEGIYVDRILQINKLFELGLSVFNSPNALYNWLQTPKQVMGETLDFESLSFSDGIHHLQQQLGRIQQGVYA